MRRVTMAEEWLERRVAVQHRRPFTHGTKALSYHTMSMRDFPMQLECADVGVESKEEKTGTCVAALRCVGVGGCTALHGDMVSYVLVSTPDGLRDGLAAEDGTEPPPTSLPATIVTRKPFCIAIERHNASMPCVVTAPYSAGTAMVALWIIAVKTTDGVWQRWLVSDSTGCCRIPVKYGVMQPTGTSRHAARRYARKSFEELERGLNEDVAKLLESPTLEWLKDDYSDEELVPNLDEEKAADERKRGDTSSETEDEDADSSGKRAGGDDADADSTVGMQTGSGADSGVGMDAGADSGVGMDAGADSGVGMDAGADSGVGMDAGPNSVSGGAGSDTETASTAAPRKRRVLRRRRHRRRGGRKREGKPEKGSTRKRRKYTVGQTLRALIRYMMSGKRSKGGLHRALGLLLSICKHSRVCPVLGTVKNLVPAIETCMQYDSRAQGLQVAALSVLATMSSCPSNYEVLASAPGLLRAVASAMRHHATNANAVSLAALILSRVGRHEAAGTAWITDELLEGIVMALGRHVTDGGVVRSLMHLLSRTPLSTDTDGVAAHAEALVESVLSAVLAHADAEAEQRAGFSAVASLAADATMRAMFLRRKACVEYIPRALAAHNGSPSVVAAVLSALGRLCDRRSASRLCGAVDLLPALATAMATHVSHVDVQIAALRCVGQLVVDEGTAAAVTATPRLVSAVAASLQEHSLEPEVQLHGLTAVANLGSHAVSRRRLHSAHGVVATMQLDLEAHIDDVAVQRCVIAALHSMVERDGAAATRLVQTPGLLPSLLDSLKAHADDGKVQIAGFHLLAALVCDSGVNATKVCAADGFLDHLVAALQVHVRDEAVQSEGWMLVSHLAMATAVTATAVGAVTGLLRCLTTAMQAHRCSLDVSRCTVLAVATVTSDNAANAAMFAANDDALVALRDAMSTHAEDQELLSQAFGALANMACEGTSNSARIASVAGFPQCIVSTMESHLRHADVLQEACIALQFLALSAPARAALHAHGVAKTLKACRDAYPLHTDLITQVDAAEDTLSVHQ